MKKHVFWGVLVALLFCSVIVPNTFAVQSLLSTEEAFVVIHAEQTRRDPSAETWTLGFSLLTSDKANQEAVLKSVKIGDRGKAFDVTAAVSEEARLIPVNFVEGLNREQLSRWNTLRKRSALGYASVAEQKEYALLSEPVMNSIKDGGHVMSVSIVLDKLPFTIIEGQSYPVSLDVESDRGIQTLTTLVSVAALPEDPSWSPAELHCHSAYPNTPDEQHGMVSLRELAVLFGQELGYKILYVTDHENLVASKGSWAEYASAVSTANIYCTSIKMYPGLEVTAKDWIPQLMQYSYCDVLCYGIVSHTYIDNMAYYLQQQIDYVASNNPGKSSASIAHPESVGSAYLAAELVPTRYRGFEVIHLVPVVSPTTRWRSELSRLLSETFANGYFPSARAGSDFHGDWLTPTPAGFVTWVKTSQWSNKTEVDAALYRGRTVASKKGGLAYLTVMQGVTELASVGDQKTVAAGTSLTLRVTFRPIETNYYYIKLYRDNKTQLVGSWSGYYYKSSSPTTLDVTNYSFPGGEHYYFVEVTSIGDDDDTIFTSPLFLKS